MKTTQKIILISLFLIATLIASGCQANESTADQAEKPAATSASTQVIQPTETVVLPSATSTKRPTLKPTSKPTENSDGSLAPTLDATTKSTATATLQVTATPTEVKIADWTSAKFFTGGALADWQYFIALEFDGNLTGSYYAVVDKNKNYKCEILAMYPNRLYCHGPQAAFMDYVRFEVFDKTTDEKVYQERVWIPGTYFKK
jgi:hypothetical protein